MPPQTYSDFFSPASTAHNQIDQLIGELGDPGSIRAADPWWNMYGQAKESVGDWLGEMLPPSPGVEPGTPRYESAEENIKNLFGLIPQEKWELPLYALGGAGSLKKGKKLLSGAKSKKSVSDYLEKMMKRMRAEEQGADILYSNMEKGVYPRDTAKKFYSDVYPSLKPDVQKQFRHWSQTGEFYPGATKGGKAIDVPFDEQIDDYISETFPSIKSHGEDAVYDFIEGTWDNPASRGELSYMSMINDMFDAAKQGKPSSVAEFLSGTQAAKALPEKGISKLHKTAKKVFGTTDDARESGFIIEDGSMLDFSAPGSLKKQAIQQQAAFQGQRYYSHGDIKNVGLERTGGLKEFEGIGTQEFVNSGGIRWIPESFTFQIGKIPTKEQLSKMKDVYERSKEKAKFTFGIHKTNRFGQESNLMLFSKYDWATRQETPWKTIERDILQFYRTGRGPSVTQQFR